MPYLEFIRYDVASARDLRSAILEAAVESGTSPIKLHLITPKLNRGTIEKVWSQVLGVLHPEIAARMRYYVSSSTQIGSQIVRTDERLASVRLDRPNYTFEVLRIIANATMSRAQPLNMTRINQLIGASQTPVRRALRVLEDAELIRGFNCDVSSITLDALGRIGALPQTLRLRFKQGATPRSPQGLLERARKAMLITNPGWFDMSISGVPAANVDLPDLDLFGLPRLDLCFRIERHAVAKDLRMLDELSTGLEIEPNPTAPAPVVISVVRANVDLRRTQQLGGVASASRLDVYLSLLDMGLRAQAIAYAEHFAK